MNVKRVGDWADVLNESRLTVGKEEVGKEPSDKFKKDVVRAEHSPIHSIRYRWTWEGIKYWITNHFVRHTWDCWVRSQRNDRTGEERDSKRQDSPVDMTCEVNIQHLIDTSRKRLCNCAHAETREKWQEVVDGVREIDPVVAHYLVPNCIYRGGCPEPQSCGLYKKFIECCINTAKSGQSSPVVLIDMLSDIDTRYGMYHFYKKNGDL